MTVLYEDNHIIAVNKTCNEIVQGDKTGDTPLSEMVKAYIKDICQSEGRSVSETVCQRSGLSVWRTVY